MALFNDMDDVVEYDEDDEAPTPGIFQEVEDLELKLSCIQKELVRLYKERIT